MTTDTPKTQPPMPGSELFIHNAGGPFIAFFAMSGVRDVWTSRGG